MESSTYSNTFSTGGVAATHFLLKIWVPNHLPELTTFYVQSAAKHNSVVQPVIHGGNQTFDAGFDLICPDMVCALSNQTTKINHLVRCSMVRVDTRGEYPVGYYLYPRSSTGTKTPLRLANSVGIIDSGYRGGIIAAMDNWMQDDYVVDKGQRIVQLCPPDLSYPVRVLLVDSVEELGQTCRGDNGFGSTGL